MRQLKSAVEPSGSIVVFNAPFEKGRLKECSEFLPEYKSWVAAVNQRIVDLLHSVSWIQFLSSRPVGSASLKSVFPALTGKDYTNLEIQEGGMASLEFLRVTFCDVSESERMRVRQALDEYCGLDTQA